MNDTIKKDNKLSMADLKLEAGENRIDVFDGDNREIVTAVTGDGIVKRTPIDKLSIEDVMKLVEKPQVAEREPAL